jgi:hypothetical protein
MKRWLRRPEDRTDEYPWCHIWSASRVPRVEARQLHDHICCIEARQLHDHICSARGRCTARMADEITGHCPLHDLGYKCPAGDNEPDKEPPDYRTYVTV